MISPRYAQARQSADLCADFTAALVDEVWYHMREPDHFCKVGLYNSLSSIAGALESRLGRIECRLMVYDGRAIMDIAKPLAAAVDDADSVAAAAYEEGADSTGDGRYGDGYGDGYNEGYSVGYDAGYSEGYEEGQAEAEAAGIELSCPQCAGSLDESLKCDSCCREFSLIQKGA